jgi:hypothetical protein
MPPSFNFELAHLLNPLGPIQSSGFKLVANRRPTKACSRTSKGAPPISAVPSGLNLFWISALGGTLRSR